MLVYEEHEKLDLSTNLSGFILKNPTMLTAGVIGRSAALLKYAMDQGAGGATAGSFGLVPKTGHANPIVTTVQTSLHERPIGYINAVGFDNPGLDSFLHNWDHTYGTEDLPLAISVYAFEMEDYAELARKVEDSAAKAMELNLSSPNTKLAGLDQGKDAEKVNKAVEMASENTHKPIFVKISPTLSDVKSMALTAVRAGAKGIIATNTAKSMVIDIESGKPILTNKTGGLSGPALHPIAVRCVYEVREALDENGYEGLPIIGCGGVSSWEDAVEFMCAGASAVQLGTGLIFRSANPSESFKLFNEIVEGIRSYLVRTDRSLKEVIGLAHR